MVNLACSDDPYKGYGVGKMVNVIGDSSSGKTYFALTTFAEVSTMREYDEYRLIYDDAETALEIDLKKAFGKRCADRIDKSVRSNTATDFFGNVMKALDKGKPFIYVLDSFDALAGSADEEVADKLVNDKELSGSYQMDKPKMASQMFRTVMGELFESDSVLIIVSQTRDNIGVTFGSKKTRSGGKALKFYATHELWLAVESREKDPKYKRVLGSNVVAKISKNKITGKERIVNFPIYYDLGVDDTASCINFLVENGYWKKRTGGIVIANDLDFEGTVKKLITHVEDNNLENDLREIAGMAWNEIEESIKLNRKRRYGD